MSVSEREVLIREVSGREVSGQEVSGREVSGREMSGLEVLEREMSKREFSGREEAETEEKEVFSCGEAKKAAEKAMALLLFKDRTRQELVTRLYRAGFSETALSEAMAYVERFGYINDRRYVENYVMFQKGKKSRREMVYQLTERGIEGELISEVLEECDYDGEQEAIRMLLKKKLKGRLLCETAYEERQKIMAYLGRKGYEFHTIKKVFSQLDNEDKKV